ncbi:MAG: FtsX-like permease family protein, partial [Bacteroidota bacterium]
MNTILGLKLALRALGKRPAFTAVVVFTFAIVTSTSIVVYSYIDALLFSPLPFKEADRLVRVYSMKGDEQGLLSYPEFLDMQKELVNIEELAVYRDGGRYNLSSSYGKPPEELTTTFASSNLFRVLGVEPQLGAYWPETLDKRGSHTVMLTHDFWQRRYDGDPNVEGLEVNLDGFTYLNYGVLPEGFSFPVRNEAFRAMAFADFVVTARNRRPCIGLARLNAGVTLEQFNDELAKFAASQEQRHQESNLGITFVAEPLSYIFIGELRGYLLLIGGAILFLLAIAVVNVSNLFVSQAIRRSRETTVRKILGSTSLQIIQGFVLHAFLLAVIGSGIGLFLAWYLMGASYELVSPFLPYWTVIDINWSVILYTIGLAILLGLLTGVIPWLFHRRGGNMSEGLKEGQHSVGSGRQHTVQKGLATAQIAVSVLLLIGG